MFEKQPVHVIKTTEVSEILDTLNVLRYKVILNTYIDSLSEQTFYIVEVYNMFLYEQPLLIYSQDKIELPQKAYEIYCEMVKNYKFLVKCETKPPCDISNFKNQIGYHKAKCCATCKFVKQHNIPQHKCHHIIYICECPKNFIKLKNDLGDDHHSDNMFRDNPEHIFCPSIEKEVFEHETGIKPSDIDVIWAHERYRDPKYNCMHIDFHFEVEPIGICKHFEEK